MNVLDQSLDALARSIPGAIELLHAHSHDFCCGSKPTLRDAATRRGVDAEVLMQRPAALRADLRSGVPDWRNASAREAATPAAPVESAAAEPARRNK